MASAAKSGKVFYIQLDKAEGQLYYTAADTVRGKVVLDSANDEDVINISVKFIGRTKSEIFEFFESANRGPTVKPGMAIHLQQTRTLVRENQTLRASRYEWDFSFEFPASTQPESNFPAAERVEWKPSRYFRNSSQSHPLPPSSEHLGMDYSGRNEYFLQAVLQRKTKSGGESETTSPPMQEEETLEDVEMLHYILPDVMDPQPREDMVVEDSTVHEVKSYKLDPSYRNRKLSLKEKSKSLVGASSVPTFFFSPTFSVPSRAYLGEDITVTVGLKLYPERSTAPDVPPVEFQYVHISLMAESRARCQIATGSARQHQEGSGEKAVVERSLRDLDTFVASSQYRKFVRFAFGRVTPSFSTYNYALDYHLLVGCLFKVADQTIKVEKQLPIRILPDRRGTNLEGFYVPREDMMLGDFQPLFDPTGLPSYEEVLTPTPPDQSSTPARSDDEPASSARHE